MEIRAVAWREAFCITDWMGGKSRSIEFYGVPENVFFPPCICVRSRSWKDGPRVRIASALAQYIDS